MIKKIYDFIKEKPMARKIVNFISFAFLFYAGLSLFTMNAKTIEKIPYSEFLNMVEDASITDVEIKTKDITAKAVNANKIYQVKKVDDPTLVDKLHKSKISFKQVDEEPGALISVILYLLRWILPTFLLIWLLRKSMDVSSFNFSFKGANGDAEKITDINFSNVAGQDEAKEQLGEIISFLHEPEKYKEIGAKIPKGALLVGQPGTGKTLLAKAVAGEANVPFLSVSGSDFIELYVGVGAKRVREIFAEAKKLAPCIIFIDEVDSIAKSRNSGVKGNGNDEREQTLNQLLSEMDGFEPYSGIVVLAATNRPELLDKAFVRAGRFDRKITINPPDIHERLEILKVHTRDKKISKDVNLNEIAEATAGAVGADLANIVNEAAIRAVKCGRSEIIQEDLHYAFEFLIAGAEKKNKILSDEERNTVAYHELGHALIAAIKMNEVPIQKITIVPRTNGALGYTLQSAKNDEYLLNKERMISEIMVLLGGRAAEEVKFKTITTGAYDDIEKATNIARKMITVYGMADEFGPISIEKNVGGFLGEEYAGNISEELAAKIDSTVQTNIQDLYERTKKLVLNNIKVLDSLATVLLEKETITGNEFMEVFNSFEINKDDSITVKKKNDINTNDNVKNDVKIKNKNQSLQKDRNSNNANKTTQENVNKPKSNKSRNNRNNNQEVMTLINTDNSNNKNKTNLKSKNKSSNKNKKQLDKSTNKDINPRNVSSKETESQKNNISNQEIKNEKSQEIPNKETSQDDIKKAEKDTVNNINEKVVREDSNLDEKTTASSQVDNSDNIKNNSEEKPNKTVSNKYAININSNQKNDSNSSEKKTGKKKPLLDTEDKKIIDLLLSNKNKEAQDEGKSFNSEEDNSTEKSKTHKPNSEITEDMF